MSDYTQKRLSPATILMENGSDTSTAIYSEGRILVGILTDAGMAGGAFTFSVSHDGINYYEYRNVNDEIVTTRYSSEKWYGIFPADMSNVPYFKLISDASQSADKTITLIFRGM